MPRRDAKIGKPIPEKWRAVLDRINNNDQTAPAIAERVATLVRRAIGAAAAGKSIGGEDDLRACGLTSLGLVNLMLSVEAEFDLKVPERDMTPANFRTIARIVELVLELAPQPAATS